MNWFNSWGQVLQLTLLFAVFIMQIFITREKWVIYRKTQHLLDINEKLVTIATSTFKDMSILLGLLPNQTKRAMDPTIKQIPKETARQVESAIIKREQSSGDEIPTS